MVKRKTHDDSRLQPHEYDPKMALTLADAFYKAAERCDEQRHAEQGIEWLPIPAIVNYTFSCELYMKALLMEPEGTANVGHNLLTLFERLPLQVQGDIQQTVDCSQAPFCEMLKSASDLFEECRYIYEYESLPVNLKFVQELSLGLKKVSHEKIISAFIAQTFHGQSAQHP